MLIVRFQRELEILGKKIERVMEDAKRVNRDAFDQSTQKAKLLSIYLKLQRRAELKFYGLANLFKFGRGLVFRFRSVRSV